MGSVNEAGERLLVCALEAGAASQTKIHGLGDGAPWIFEQMDRCRTYGLISHSQLGHNPSEIAVQVHLKRTHSP
jgi:hypothetical protein